MYSCCKFCDFINFELNFDVLPTLQNATIRGPERDYIDCKCCQTGAEQEPIKSTCLFWFPI